MIKFSAKTFNDVFSHTDTILDCFGATNRQTDRQTELLHRITTRICIHEWAWLCSI